ncbi:MAG: hypothetical protein PHT41_00180 [Candidatus Omnitrophica bacterium]|nr:hypothetical protein [Candidatus Omnitrophota bacterium]
MNNQSSNPARSANTSNPKFKKYWKFIIVLLSGYLCSVIGILFLYAQENKQEKPQEENPAYTEAATTQPPKENEGLGPFKSFLSNKENTAAGEEEAKKPIEVTGDRLEYSTDAREVAAFGNVEVIYKGVKLTCQKLTLNMVTKDCLAEGNARLDEEAGVIEGEKISYNFTNKTGLMIDSQFRASPYFGRAEKVDKVSETEFITHRSYMTTCSLDRPHYRMKTRKINFFMGDRVELKDALFCLGKVPIMYLPRFVRSLKDPIMHVQVMPGKDKQWGAYVLTAWRYKITENVNGRIYFDLRQNFGIAEGFGVNYTPPGFGKGDFKLYYTQERDKSKDIDQDDPMSPKKFERYFIRWRHKWDIDNKTNFTSEYYRIVDSKMFVVGRQFNILKDYFFREYEKDTQPLSYVLMHHAFNYSSLDFLVQPRTNRWYTQLEKLPEIKYSLPNVRIGESRFYFENNTQAASYNYQHAVPSPSEDDVTSQRFDTTNKFSMPMKVAFFRLTPFVKNQETYYNQSVDESVGLTRTIFYAGADLSTKFYRIFNIKSNFLGMDINDLRHIITPSIGYSFNHEPTISSSHLKQIDSVDSIARSNAMTLELTNKLQTKRKGQSVDLVNFIVNSSYAFKPKTGDKLGSNLSDVLFKLELLPYSWMRVYTEATYKRSGNRSDEGYNTFTNVNWDSSFSLGRERWLGIGQRYQRKGGNEITFSLDWRINPKWRFYMYQRRNRGHDPTLKRGIREQEYTISRDLHCWTMDMSYNVKRGQGETVWFVFRLKAFPEMEFEINQSYHAPKPGSQSNP